MVSVLEKLPDDVVALKKIIVEQATTIKGFQEKLVAEQEKYAALQRLIFGPKSEKHQKEDSKQALLFNEAETSAKRLTESRQRYWLASTSVRKREEAVS